MRSRGTSKLSGTKARGAVKRTRAQKLAHLASLVSYSTPERLIALTAQECADITGAPLAACEQMLATARKARERKGVLL